jgi:hypothetical protein
MREPLEIDTAGKATHATKSSVGREESFAKLCGHQFRGVRREYRSFDT